jgi:hypothetical protein
MSSATGPASHVGALSGAPGESDAIVQLQPPSLSRPTGVAVGVPPPVPVGVTVAPCVAVRVAVAEITVVGERVGVPPVGVGVGDRVGVRVGVIVAQLVSFKQTASRTMSHSGGQPSFPAASQRLAVH